MNRKVLLSISAIPLAGLVIGCASGTAAKQQPVTPASSASQVVTAPVSSAPAPADTSTQYTDPNGYTCPSYQEDANGLCPSNPAVFGGSQASSSPAVPATEAPAGTVSQQQALERAKSYLDMGGFSRLGLIDQLEYEKFSTADATWAVDHSGANWDAQAVEKAKSYMESVGGFSRGSLIDQLLYDKFTQAQAVYAADQVGL